MGFGTVFASLLAIVLAIAVVAALAFGFIYLLKLWQDRSLHGGEQRVTGIPMRFIRTLPLGQSERLVLVEVGEEVLLLGVAAHSISVLRDWPIDAVPQLDEAASAPSPLAASASALADRFRRVPRPGGRS